MTWWASSYSMTFLKYISIITQVFHQKTHLVSNYSKGWLITDVFSFLLLGKIYQDQKIIHRLIIDLDNRDSKLISFKCSLHTTVASYLEIYNIFKIPTLTISLISWVSVVWERNQNLCRRKINLYHNLAKRKTKKRA